MIKYILKRVSISMVTILVILFFLFTLLDFMPGSPFNDEKLSQQQLEILNEKYGLDDPFYLRFAKYVENVFVHQDFGDSYVIKKNASVNSLLTSRIATTIRIGSQAILLGTFVGIILGIIAGVKKNTIYDSLTTIIAVLGVSIPSYVFALGLSYYVGYKLELLPITYQMKEPMVSSVLPTIALSMFVTAQVARFLRTELIEILKSDYIKLANAKGLSGFTVIFKHALRNGLIPVITVLGPLLVNLMVGSLVVEKIFRIPGIGGLLVESIQVNDFNVVIAIAFIYSILYITVNLAVDILYGIIDPRIRLSKGE